MVELPDISHLDEGVVVPHQPVNENSQWTPDEFTDLPDDEGPPQQAPVKLRRGGRLPPWAPRFIIAGQPLRLLANANQNPNLSCKLGGFGQGTYRVSCVTLWVLTGVHWVSDVEINPESESIHFWVTFTYNTS